MTKQGYNEQNSNYENCRTKNRVCVCVYFQKKMHTKKELQKDFIDSEVAKRHINHCSFDDSDLDPESNKIKLFHKQKICKVIKIMDSDYIFDVVK